MTARLVFIQNAMALYDRVVANMTTYEFARWFTELPKRQQREYEIEAYCQI